MNANKLKAETQ